MTQLKSDETQVPRGARILRCAGPSRRFHARWSLPNRGLDFSPWASGEDLDSKRGWMVRNRSSVPQGNKVFQTEIHLGTRTIFVENAGSTTFINSHRF